MLTPDLQRVLLDLAVDSIRQALRTGRRPAVDVTGLPDPLRAPGASFVTLRRGDVLLGCIGTLVPFQPLGVDVAGHACNAAFDDPRMPPIDVADFVVMSVHVSVLGPLAPLDAGSYDDVVRQLRAGRDGVLLEAPGRRGTLLPSVWADLPEPELFATALWRKAGLPARGWPRGTRASVYGVEEFGDDGPRAW